MCVSHVLYSLGAKVMFYMEPIIYFSLYRNICNFLKDGLLANADVEKLRLAIENNTKSIRMVSNNLKGKNFELISFLWSVTQAEINYIQNNSVYFAVLLKFFMPPVVIK